MVDAHTSLSTFMSCTYDMWDNFLVAITLSMAHIATYEEDFQHTRKITLGLIG